MNPYFALLPAVVAAAFLALGSVGHAQDADVPTIREVQRKLQERGLYAGGVDGVAGSQTAAAIRRFQLEAELKVTGKINRQTLDFLGIDPSVLLPTAPPASEQLSLARLFSGGPYSEKSPSFQREFLARVQKVLARAGDFDGKADGWPSDEFERALRRWQASAALNPVGRFDSATVAALQKRLPRN